jgi:hypothetical protein
MIMYCLSWLGVYPNKCTCSADWALPIRPSGPHEVVFLICSNLLSLFFHPWQAQFKSTAVSAKWSQEVQRPIKSSNKSSRVLVRLHQGTAQK